RTAGSGPGVGVARGFLELWVDGAAWSSGQGFTTLMFAGDQLVATAAATDAPTWNGGSMSSGGWAGISAVIAPEPAAQTVSVGQATEAELALTVTVVK